MHRDMAAYDEDITKYTQSLGCWHGFIGQQKVISIRKHFGTADRRHLYLSGWTPASIDRQRSAMCDTVFAAE